MLTFGPSAMQRLLQQNETIKQTTTGLRNQLELAVIEMQTFSEDADLATKPDVQSLETEITVLKNIVDGIEEKLEAGGDLATKPDVQSLETEITVLTHLVSGIKEKLEAGGYGSSD